MSVRRSLAATAAPTGPGDLPPEVAARHVPQTTAVVDLGVLNRGEMAMIAVAPAHEVVATRGVRTAMGPVHVPAGATPDRDLVTASRGVRRSARTAGEVVWLPRGRDCLNPGSRTR